MSEQPLAVANLMASMRERELELVRYETYFYFSVKCLTVLKSKSRRAYTFFIVKSFVNLLCHVQEEDLEEEDEEDLEETLTVTEADATAIGEEEDSASKSPPPSSASPPPAAVAAAAAVSAAAAGAAAAAAAAALDSDQTSVATSGRPRKRVFLKYWSKCKTSVDQKLIKGCAFLTFCNIHVRS